MSILPFDDRDGTIWLNGELLPWRDARVHVLTHGLHYASSIFEGVRAYNGRIFKNTEHNERFHASARMLGMTLPYSVADLDRACEETLTASGLKDAYIRPVAWRGSEMMAISAQQTSVHVAIAIWEMPSYFGREAREKGLKLRIGPWRRPRPDTAPVHAKAAGLYMICTLSKHAAEADGYNDALMLDWRGFIAECTGANIFFVIDGRLHTPKADCFLDGITRRTVIDLAKQKGIEVVERHMAPDELALAEEVFVTGTAAEITPIGRIDGYAYEVGPVTRGLIEAYEGLVRR